MPTLRAAAFAALLLLPFDLSEAAAQNDPVAPTEPEDGLKAVEEAVVEALRRAMALLATTLDAAVPYELPEVQPNGDIIIRRKPPDKETVPEKGAEDGVIRL